MDTPIPPASWPSPGQGNALAGTTPDVYFTEAYGRAAASSDAAEWISIVLADGAWQVPLLTRRLSSGRSDAVSPYGYSGVYAAPQLTASQVSDLWRQTRASLGSLGVVSIFVRESPLVPQADVPDDAVWVVRSHDTFFVPAGGYETNWHGYRGSVRTAIRKCEQLGLSCEIGPATVKDVEPGAEFRELYAATMSKVSASSYYAFKDGYYDLLAGGLESNLLIGTVRAPSGEALASALFMRGSEVLHYHLSGSSEDGARAGATTMLLDRAVRLANDQHLAGLMLGGGVQQGDGLEKFKARFGGERRSFKAYGLVIDQEAYEAETAARALELGCSEQDLLRPGFFPAYRRPAPVAAAPGADQPCGDGCGNS